MVFLQTEETGNYAVFEEEKPSRTTMGPVDYLIVRFPGNKFSGKIVPELTDLEKQALSALSTWFL